MEILAPAGSTDALIAGVRCGANAVYLGMKNINARRNAANFGTEELASAVKYCHERNVKVYVTLNILVSDEELETAVHTAEEAINAGADGFIVQDLGLAKILHEQFPKVRLHASTQCSVNSPEGFKALEEAGFVRAVIPREMSLEEIKEIRKATDMELELFVHGALCMSVSGQCYMSAMLGGRSGNRGLCAQPCRLPFSADESKSCDLSLKDLSLLSHLKEIEEAGVCSLKIEGRMKSEYYLATVINAYRRAMDDYYKNGVVYKNNILYTEELEKTAHREFTTAYLCGENDRTENFDDSQSSGTHKFIATVIEGNKDGYVLIEMRNRFKSGDELEILSPSESFNKKITVKKMTDENGNEIDDAKLVQQKIRLYTDIPLCKGDFLRKKI